MSHTEHKDDAHDEQPSLAEETFRAGFVAIVGRPNVGKSTLINRLVGERIAITTPKPQTTRDRIRGIRTFDDWQAVYVDTPGIHQGGNLLNRYMVNLAVGTMADSDLVYLLVDAAHMHAKPEAVLKETSELVEPIADSGTPTYLLFNKVDRLKDKASLLPMVESLSTLHHFEEIVPVSALKGEGEEELRKLTRPRLPLSPPLFPEDSLTDRSLRFLASEIIREQLLMQLKQELPYHVAVSIDSWEEKGNLVTIYASIHVARESHKGMVIGRGGKKLKSVGQKARLNLEEILNRKIFLDLRVRVESKWMDREAGLRKFGYTEDGS